MSSQDPRAFGWSTVSNPSGIAAYGSRPGDSGLAADTWLVADTDSRAVRMIEHGSVMRTAVGCGENDDEHLRTVAPLDGIGTDASFKSPTSLAVDSDGTVALKLC